MRRYAMQNRNGEVFSLANDEEAPAGCQLVAVIPLEDREAVERLAGEFLTHATAQRATVEAVSNTMQAALREFAAPKPAKPEEPLGLGAVVEDADGVLWLRHEGSIAPWHRSDGQPNDRSWRYFTDITAVRVLSEGVVQP